jgi:FtsH-binding integral membrane protein
MFAILKNFSQYCIVIQCSLVFSVIFVSNFCFMVKQFLYIIGLHWAVLGFLAVAPLFCVVSLSRGMDVRCSSVFYCLFFWWRVSMDYGGVVGYLRII